MKKLTIGVIFGGRSGEHEVSVLSGKNVIAALEQSGYTTVPILIDKNGRWSSRGKPVTLSPVPDVGLREDRAGRRIPIDIYFPILHGTYGEDGTIQGLFEMANVPYVGAGVLGSAVGLDKEAQKLLFLYHGLSTPQFEVVHRDEWEISREAVFRRLSQRIGFPSFVKPANMGSSVGVTKAKNLPELTKAIQKALKFDTKILVEEFVTGREVDCAVLGNENPRVSLPGEIIPKREFYDYRAKYVAEDTQYKFAVPLPEHIKDKFMRMAQRVFQITFCAGMARVEFLLTKSEEVFVMEINTLPGCTEHSLFPRLWEASGLSFPEVVDTLIRLAQEHWQKKHTLKTSAAEGRLIR